VIAANDVTSTVQSFDARLESRLEADQPGGQMKRIIFLIALGAAVSCMPPVRAGSLETSATISATPDGSNWDYTIALTNLSSSTDSLETFWYSWVPGKDFMPVSPLSVSPPTGWTDMVTNGGPTDGFAIQFVTTSAALTPGNTLDFSFTSAATPAQLAGDSPFYPGIPVGTSFVYQGAPFVGDSFNFVVSSVPEPSTLTLALVGGLVGFVSLRAHNAVTRHRASRLMAVES
jgi:hypothetical protein